MGKWSAQHVINTSICHHLMNATLIRRFCHVSKMFSYLPTKDQHGTFTRLPLFCAIFYIRSAPVTARITELCQICNCRIVCLSRGQQLGSLTNIHRTCRWANSVSNWANSSDECSCSLPLIAPIVRLYIFNQFLIKSIHSEHSKLFWILATTLFA